MAPLGEAAQRGLQVEVALCPGPGPQADQRPARVAGLQAAAAPRSSVAAALAPHACGSGTKEAEFQQQK